MTAPSPPTRAVLVLGAGYTARWVYRFGQEQGWDVTVTSREPDRHLAYATSSGRFLFDLNRPETWRNLPHEADVLWCFPAEPVRLVTEFARASGLAARRLVVLGSTSAYSLSDLNEQPPPWVDETAPIDLTKPRVEGEEWLRNTCGAIVLRVAGIYGPGRNPLNWIRQGRVGPCRKYVNLIHVDDLARICLLALERGRRGEVYNVSDGTPRTWLSICQVAGTRWGLAPQAGKSDRGVGKRVATGKLRTELAYQLQHPDLYRALELLDREAT